MATKIRAQDTVTALDSDGYTGDPLVNQTTDVTTTTAVRTVRFKGPIPSAGGVGVEYLFFPSWNVKGMAWKASAGVRVSAINPAGAAKFVQFGYKFGAVTGAPEYVKQCCIVFDDPILLADFPAGSASYFALAHAEASSVDCEFVAWG